MVKVICIGEVMAEISGPSGAFQIGFAGDTYNTAVYLARALGGAGQVRYLTRLGADPLSLACRAEAEAHFVDISLSGTDADAAMGIYAIATDAAGERSFTYWRKDAAARRLFTDPQELEALNGADLIYFSGISLAILGPRQRADFLAKLTELRASGTRIAFDSNYRPALWGSDDTARQVMSEAWAICDIALPSVDDEMALFADTSAQEVLARLSRQAFQTGALKRGALGPMGLDGVPLSGAETVTAVDTTAAGDSFNAGFLAAVLAGQDVQAAMRSGHDLACKVVQQRGAIVET
jgi:2-dehydro-3-deoxygluconokinase